MQSLVPNQPKDHRFLFGRDLEEYRGRENETLSRTGKRTTRDQDTKRDRDRKYSTYDDDNDAFSRREAQRLWELGERERARVGRERERGRGFREERGREKDDYKPQRGLHTLLLPSSSDIARYYSRLEEDVIAYQGREKRPSRPSAAITTESHVERSTIRSKAVSARRRLAGPPSPTFEPHSARSRGPGVSEVLETSKRRPATRPTTLYTSALPSNPSKLPQGVDGGPPLRTPSMQVDGHIIFVPPPESPDHLVRRSETIIPSPLQPPAPPIPTPRDTTYLARPESPGHLAPDYNRRGGSFPGWPNSSRRSATQQFHRIRSNIVYDDSYTRPLAARDTLKMSSVSTTSHRDANLDYGQYSDAHWDTAPKGSPFLTKGENRYHNDTISADHTGGHGDVTKTKLCALSTRLQRRLSSRDMAFYASYQSVHTTKSSILFTNPRSSPTPRKTYQDYELVPRISASKPRTSARYEHPFDPMVVNDIRVDYEKERRRGSPIGLIDGGHKR